MAREDLHGFHLFGKRIAEGVPAQGNDDTFLFLHIKPPALSLFYSGDRLYLAEDSFRKRFYRNAGARRLACEILCVHFVKCSEITHICKEACRLDNISELSALALEKRLDILHDLLCLLLDRRAHDFPCFRGERDLS